MTGTMRRGGWRIWTWGLAGLLLVAAVAASRLTKAMNWGLEDVLSLAGLLLAACLGLELVMRLARRPAHRVLGGVVVLGLVLLAWAELAVGVF